MKLKKIMLIPFAFVGLIGLASCNGGELPSPSSTVTPTTAPTTPATSTPTTAPTTPAPTSSTTTPKEPSREVKFLSKYLSDAAKASTATDKFGFELDFNAGLICVMNDTNYTFELNSVNNLFLNLHNATANDNLLDKMEAYFESNLKIKTDARPFVVPQLDGLADEDEMTNIFNAYYNNKNAYVNSPLLPTGLTMDLAGILEGEADDKVKPLVSILSYISTLNMYGADGNATAALISAYLPALDDYLAMLNPTMEEKVDETIIKLSVDPTMFLSVQVSGPRADLEISFAKEEYKINYVRIAMGGVAETNFVELLSSALGFDLTKYIPGAYVNNLEYVLKPVAYNELAIPTEDAFTGYTRIKWDEAKQQLAKIGEAFSIMGQIGNAFAYDGSNQYRFVFNFTTTSEEVQYDVVGQLLVRTNHDPETGDSQVELKFELEVNAGETAVLNVDLDVVADIYDNKLVVTVKKAQGLGEMLPFDITGTYIIDFNTPEELVEAIKTKLMALVQSIFLVETTEETVLNALVEPVAEEQQELVIDLDAIVALFVDFIDFEKIEGDLADVYRFDLSAEKFANMVKYFIPTFDYIDGAEGTIILDVEIDKAGLFNKATFDFKTALEMLLVSEEGDAVNCATLILSHSYTPDFERTAYEADDVKFEFKLEDLLGVVDHVLAKAQEAKANIDEMMPVINATLAELMDLQDSFKIEFISKSIPTAEEPATEGEGTEEPAAVEPTEATEPTEKEVGATINVSYDFQENMVLRLNGESTLLMPMVIEADVQDGMLYYSIQMKNGEVLRPLFVGKIELNEEFFQNAMQVLPKVLLGTMAGKSEAQANVNTFDVINKLLDLFEFKKNETDGVVTSYQYVIPRDKYIDYMKTSYPTFEAELPEGEVDNVLTITLNVVDGKFSSVVLDATEMGKYSAPGLTEFKLSIEFTEYTQPTRLTEEELAKFEVADEEEPAEEGTEEAGEGEGNEALVED